MLCAAQNLETAGKTSFYLKKCFRLIQNVFSMQNTLRVRDGVKEKTEQYSRVGMRSGTFWTTTSRRVLLFARVRESSICETA